MIRGSTGKATKKGKGGGTGKAPHHQDDKNVSENQEDNKKTSNNQEDDKGEGTAKAPHFISYTLSAPAHQPDRQIDRYRSVERQKGTGTAAR